MSGESKSVYVCMWRTRERERMCLWRIRESKCVCVCVSPPVRVRWCPPTRVCRPRCGMGDSTAHTHHTVGDVSSHRLFILSPFSLHSLSILSSFSLHSLSILSSFSHSLHTLFSSAFSLPLFIDSGISKQVNEMCEYV